MRKEVRETIKEANEIRRRIDATRPRSSIASYLVNSAVACLMCSSAVADRYAGGGVRHDFHAT